MDALNEKVQMGRSDPSKVPIHGKERMKIYTIKISKKQKNRQENCQSALKYNVSRQNCKTCSSL